MKKISILILISFCLSSISKLNAQTNPNKIKWISFEEAIKLNETNPKKIFIDVYTDWCGWCTKMDQTTFTDPSIVEYMNENFHAVKFNAEHTEPIVFMGNTFVNKGSNGVRKGTHELAQALLQGKMSYPSYVFLNEKNQILTIVPGYAEAKEFLPILKFIGTDAFMTTTWEDFSKTQAQ